MSKNPNEIDSNDSLEDFRVTSTPKDDIDDIVNDLGAYQEYMRESRGDTLTFGDY